MKAKIETKGPEDSGSRKKPIRIFTLVLQDEEIEFLEEWAESALEAESAKDRIFNDEGQNEKFYKPRIEFWTRVLELLKC